MRALKFHLPLLAPLVPLLGACDRNPPAASTSANSSGAPEPDREPDAVPERTPAPELNAPKPLEPLRDAGIFSDLDPQVRTQCPSWLAGGPFVQVRYPHSPRVWLALDGIILCEGEPDPKIVPAKLAQEHTQDHDKDGIPDAVDLLRGAKKTVLNGASYRNSYKKLDFPGGDVPRTEGVCTDVVVRTMRNTGRDLQELLSNDIGARPSAYPMVKKPDRYIDHRRVRTLLPYFEANYRELPVDHEDSAFPYLPGDVVFMDTMGGREPEHMGVISDRLGRSGFPLIINNWTDGTVTSEMDLLGRFRVTHRFRVIEPIRLEEAHRGLSGVLRRHKLAAPEGSAQLILVTTPLWESSGGTLTRWQKSGEHFEQVGDAFRVRIGSKGLGSGRGVHSRAQLSPMVKKEGDKRAPAGVFWLGTAFGREARAPYDGQWPYRALRSGDFWIDDPRSPDYNRWITLEAGRELRWSAEKLTMYSLGLVVEHNTSDRKPGAGSAIFIHPWKSASEPTVGCTALERSHLIELLSFLDPKKKPALVQVAGRVF